jgi:hypothetical protein
VSGTASAGDDAAGANHTVGAALPLLRMVSSVPWGVRGGPIGEPIRELNCRSRAKIVILTRKFLLRTG